MKADWPGADTCLSTGGSFCSCAYFVCTFEIFHNKSYFRNIPTNLALEKLTFQLGELDWGGKKKKAKAVREQVALSAWREA